eukprot:13862244-Alexandrium_andersonii.AAC.1
MPLGRLRAAGSRLPRARSEPGGSLGWLRQSRQSTRRCCAGTCQRRRLGLAPRPSSPSAAR